jgi:tRNA-dihydrouridine synthase B
MAGSALLKDEALVGRVLEAVVRAVPGTPVTLKIRTGWDKVNRNAPSILKIAEQSGIQALTVHGRTRACGYTGHAEYETIAAIKAEAHIPIVANGDIVSPEKAKFVLDSTGADALMIGRAAQGRPWLFREIEHYLATGARLPSPRVGEIHDILLAHLEDLYDFYGIDTGVRVARKHISWYTKGLTGSAAFRHRMNQLPGVAEQRKAVDEFFLSLAEENESLYYDPTDDNDIEGPAVWKKPTTFPPASSARLKPISAISTDKFRATSTTWC